MEKANAYFINPEIKLSSVILLCLTALFFLATLAVLKINNDMLKESYTKNMGAVALRVTEEDPKLEKEIMPILTRQVSEEEASKGEAFLRQYGLNKDTETNIFPYVNQMSGYNYYSIVTIFAVMAIVLLVLNYFQFGYFYKRIRNLTVGAKKVLDGEFDISISEDREGDFSKLANSFNSMRKVIKNNLNELKLEKRFLIDLLSDISHQLKTPLSSLIIYNDIMLTKELSSKQREEFLISNKNQLYRMNWLITNLLKLAKIDAKAIEFDKEAQSLNETVQESIEALEGKALDGNIKIVFNDNEEVILNHDRLWLEEALNNIIKNGIEHTRSGGEIRIDLFENPMYKKIIIEDNGEGITEEDLPNIFKRFYKARNSQRNDSVGIGLALSKSIVEAHDGSIEVESKFGQGTKFSIVFLQ